jgi:hypothetical protein
MKFLIGAPGLGAKLPNEIRVLKFVGAFMNHGRVTHGLGLYKTGVGLQGYNVISVNSVHRLCNLLSLVGSAMHCYCPSVCLEIKASLKDCTIHYKTLRLASTYIYPT